MLLIGSMAGVYLWQQTNIKQAPAVITPVKLGTYAGTPVKEYMNETFSFKTTTEWQFIRENSTPPQKYVYYNHIDNITQYEIVVYIDAIPAKPVGFITPVTVQGSKIIPGTTSPRCGQDIKIRNGSVPMIYEEVKFECDLVNSQERFAAGVQRGSYSIPLYDSQGKLRNIGVYFTDHSPNYRPEIFNEFLASFKLR